MHRIYLLLLLLILPVGCSDTEQRRQAKRAEENAAVADHLRELGQAMHNQQNDDAAENSAPADDTTPENAPVTEQIDANAASNSSPPNAN